MADDKRIEKKDRNLNEPLQFYTGRERNLFEVVINAAAKDAVSGYISTPKNMSANVAPDPRPAQPQSTRTLPPISSNPWVLPCLSLLPLPAVRVRSRSDTLISPHDGNAPGTFLLPTRLRRGLSMFVFDLGKHLAGHSLCCPRHPTFGSRGDPLFVGRNNPARCSRPPKKKMGPR